MTVAQRVESVQINHAAAWKETAEPFRFHRLLDGYAPTPLVDAPSVAETLGLGRLFIKSEVERFDLPAFKVLGASWAIAKLASRELGIDVPAVSTLDELKTAFRPLVPLTLTTATDGNHGRAVAKVARLLGFEAEILVPAGTTRARIEAIRQEGATVIETTGTYDEAVSLAVERSGERCLVVADTSDNADDPVPRWIVDGYSTLFLEIDEQLRASGQPEPDVVVIPVGVGSLAAAAVLHFAARCRVVGIEPTSAACVLESLAAGSPINVGPANTSIMAGLNTGTPSHVAWPLLQRDLTAVVSIDDDQVGPAMIALDGIGIEAGETGAAGLAGLMAIMADPSAADLREMLRLGPGSSVVTLVTEGPTDPDGYAALVGHPPASPPAPDA